MRSQNKVALRQVAHVAGVSLGTASNVFANKPGVSLKARNAVLEAALRLGYQPVSRALLSHEEALSSDAHLSKDNFTAYSTFGLLIRSMQLPFPLNPFYSHVLHGCESMCTAQHISLMYAVVGMQEDESETVSLPLMVQRQQVQGLLTVGYFPDTFFQLLQESAIPFVTVDHYDARLGTDSITAADEEGGYQATRYLIEQGYRNPVPAMLAGPFSHSSLYQRWLGYKRALCDAGLQYDPAYVRFGDTNLDGGYSAMKELLALQPRPEAVFCCTDITALGALNALHDQGIEVPDECSLVGYDDIDVAAHTIPALTTMHVDKELLGSQAVRILLERLASPAMPPLHTSIGVTLVERRSVTHKTRTHKVY